MKRYATIVALALLASTLSVGAVLASTDISDQNKVGYWCEDGVKYEPVDTPYVVPTPPEGTAWTLLVLKAGSGEGANETFANPTSGQSYVHSTGKDISHAILCGASITVTTTTVASPQCTLGVKTPYGSLNLTTTFLYQPNLPAIYYQLIAPDGTVFGPPLPTGTYTSTVPGQWYVCYVEEYVTTTSTTTTAPVTTTSSSTTTTENQTTTTEVEETTTTSAQLSTTTTTLGELPMTGPEDLWLFGLAGLVLLVLGAIAVWAVREQQ